MKLTHFEQRLMAVVGRAIMPLGILGGLTDNRDVGAEVARQLALAPWWSAIGVRAGLWAVWFAPLWRWGRPKFFGGLVDADKYAILDTLSRSNLFWLREMVMLLKLSICFALMGDRKVLTYLGAYDTTGGPVALRKGDT